MKIPATSTPARRALQPLVALAVLWAAGMVASPEAWGQAAEAAAEGGTAEGLGVASLAILKPPTPRIRGGFDARLRTKVTSAFRVATQQVLEVPACAGLFARFGTDGVARLRAARYEWVGDTGGERVCGRGPGAAAFTMVRSPRTIVCQGFSRLDADDAAVILIHEALHSAGQTEWPDDPLAPSAEAINKMVRSACGL